MALMGHDTLMLYTEDTYEIPEYPYFGYMRGRYSQTELKALDEYAGTFGIETVPCIQTLAHMNQALRWRTFSGIIDHSDILLADNEETYALIEAMLRSCRNSFSSKRIHIGMDEAHMLGLGKYREIHGDISPTEIICCHLKKVASMCEKYGFEPIMWSDMFFRLAFGGYYGEEDISPEVREMIPVNVGLVYWDYYQDKKEAYDDNVRRHQVFSNPIIFAGGVWRWKGFAPALEKSLEMSRLALESCAEHGIGDVFLTAWGDNGSESAMFSVLPVLQLYAEVGYGQTDISAEKLSSRLNVCTGETLERMLLLDLPDLPELDRVKDVGANPSKYLLYQDVLCGLFDRHTDSEYPSLYKEASDRLKKAAEESTMFGYMYQTLAALCETLALKCDVGVQLKEAYDNNNIEQLRGVKNKLFDVLAAVERFHICIEAQWMTECKPFGYEVQDIRLGGLETRLKTTARRIQEYIDGKTDRLEELEEERLYFDCRTTEEPLITVENTWSRIATASLL